MITEPITTASLAKGIAVSLGKWLWGLWEASEKEQIESLDAIDAVIPVLRKTMAYSRMMDKGACDPNTVSAIAEQWSQVANQLRKLNLNSLATLCDLKSRYWADPERFETELLVEADISFRAVERLARDTRIQVQLRRKGRKK